MIDYELLLKKYINYILELEGTDYIDTFNPGAVSMIKTLITPGIEENMDFSKEEMEELMKISEQMRND